MGIDTTDELDFTENAWEAMYDTVDSTYFRDQDADLIYRTLQERLTSLSFGDYLKRYLYQRMEMTAPFEEVPLADYQQIIRDAFAEHGTPASFAPTTAKLGALAKNWLSQRAVKREVVFLLGFGLAMTVEDVNAFLTKALREQGINAKDPFEVICWYCFRNGDGFSTYERLWNMYQDTSADRLAESDLSREETSSVRNTMYGIQSEGELCAFLAQLKTADNRTRTSVTAQRQFRILYDQGRDIIARMRTQEEGERFDRELAEYRAKLEANDRLFDYEKRQRLQDKRAERKIYLRSDITESDFEHVICSAIPVDRHGNLTPGKASRLNEAFSGKRFSRQHIHDILSGKAAVNRFDLITLNFFLYSQREDFARAEQRYGAFIDSTNEILESCFLGPLYIANPYECFVLMCILSDDPLGTYADVWELSYGEQPAGHREAAEEDAR